MVFRIQLVQLVHCFDFLQLDYRLLNDYTSVMAILLLETGKGTISFQNISLKC